MKDKLRNIACFINKKKYYAYALITMFFAQIAPVYAVLGEYTEKVSNTAGTEADGMLVGAGVLIVIGAGGCVILQKRKMAIALVAGYLIGFIIIKNRVAIGNLFSSMG